MVCIHPLLNAYRIGQREGLVQCSRRAEESEKKVTLAELYALVGWVQMSMCLSAYAIKVMVNGGERDVRFTENWQTIHTCTLKQREYMHRRPKFYKLTHTSTLPNNARFLVHRRVKRQ